jgi:phosphatidylserine/phosphatidylglycerophosphate/cardiolipin synthase-like enzyme
VNEPLRRALLGARLSEEEVAARLQVDPKTVRRWLEGRVPYLRHRWVLTGLLDADEADLWPEVRAAIIARSRPADLKAVYPSRQAMPRQAWHSLFRSARQEIAIFARSALFLAKQPGVLDVLGERARAGVRVRICLQNPDPSLVAEGENEIKAAEIEEALALFSGLRDNGAETRLHRTILYNSIYRADNQILVTQHVFGIPAERQPVLYLRAEAAGDMTTTYIDVIERIWTSAVPAE